MNIDTTTDGRPRLAQELFDLILDYLHYDPRSLKRCSLVSKSLLPTCQRHLFSAFQIAKGNIAKLVKLFALPTSINGHDEDAILRVGVTDLLNGYTTHLILTDPEQMAKSAVRLPKFKNVQKITFKGDELNSSVTIPSFLEQTWMSSSSNIRSVEFDFRLMHERGILESFCVLPARIEDIGFASARTGTTVTQQEATLIRKNIENQHLPDCSSRGVRQFNGSLKLRLSRDLPHERLLSFMLKFKDLFKFSFKHISYRLTYHTDIQHFASLVDECKGTLQSLDITISSPQYGSDNTNVQSFDFSRHHALRSIRIWTPPTFDPDWLCSAISSIPTPSNASPRALLPLRIGLHISLPTWMTFPNNPTRGFDAPAEVDKLVTPWIAVDTQLARLVGLNPDVPSVTSATDYSVAKILLDISVPDLTTGPGKGVAVLMFPLLSDIKGLIRLV